MRRFSRETQRNFLRDVGRLASFLGRPPDTTTVDDLRRFQVAQQEAGLGVPTMIVVAESHTQPSTEAAKSSESTSPSRNR